jgi:hypothetical protein
VCRDHERIICGTETGTGMAWFELDRVQSPHLAVTSLPERVAQPFQTLVEPIARGSTGGLNILDHCQKVSTNYTKQGTHTQARCRKLCSPSLSVISAAFMAF